MHSDVIIQDALKMYQERPDLTTQEISRKFEIWPSTLTGWAISAKIKLRSRGPRMRLQPSAEHLAILRLSEVCGITDIGKRMNMSKQQVHRVIQRWKHWKPAAVSPFDPGDYIRVEGNSTKYKVLEAGTFQGTVEDPSGRVFHNFSWGAGGRLCKKVATRNERNPGTGKKAKGRAKAKAVR